MTSSLMNDGFATAADIGVFRPGLRLALGANDDHGDTPDTATPLILAPLDFLPSGSVGAVVLDNELGVVGDVDFFSVFLEAGDFVTIGQIGFGVNELADPFLSVFGPNDFFIFNDDINFPSVLDSEVNFIAPTTGTYFIEASSFQNQGVGVYDLAVVATSSAPQPDEDVHGDTPDTATSIVFPQDETFLVEEGRINGVSDVDVFTLNLEEGQSVNVVIVPDVDAALIDFEVSSTLNSVNFGRTIFDDQGLLLLSGRTEAGQNGELFFSVSGDQIGDYLIGFEVYDDDFGDVFTTTANVAFSEFGEDARIEGTLEIIGDRDAFRIDLIEGQTVTFSVLGDGGLNSLDDANLLFGDEIGPLEFDEDGGPGLNPLLTITAPSTGTFLIEIGAFADSLAGDYELTVEIDSAPRIDVFRFQNSINNATFLTAFESERDSVDSNLPQYILQAVPEFDAFHREAAAADGEGGVEEVYRFFNLDTGGHFFTTSEAERDNIIDNLPLIRFEGVGFGAYTDADAAEGLIPVFRIFNTTTGTHLFITSEEERDEALSTGAFIDEGIAFYAFPGGGDIQAVIGIDDDGGLSSISPLTPTEVLLSRLHDGQERSGLDAVAVEISSDELLL